uniref:Uncharacterized protein n=1 Tax=Trichuris muris TaxID=70415 RepID=A0A5S6PZ86_TRIMR
MMLRRDESARSVVVGDGAPLGSRRGGPQAKAGRTIDTRGGKLKRPPRYPRRRVASGLLLALRLAKRDPKTLGRSEEARFVQIGGATTSHYGAAPRWLDSVAQNALPWAPSGRGREKMNLTRISNGKQRPLAKVEKAAMVYVQTFRKNGYGSLIQGHLVDDNAHCDWKAHGQGESTACRE